VDEDEDYELNPFQEDSERRRIGDEVYGEDEKIDFRVLGVEDSERFTRYNNQDPSSFFTNEYC